MIEETLELMKSGEDCEQILSVFYWTTKPNKRFLEDHQFLTTLIIVGEHLNSLEGIEGLSNLKELWLVHAKLGQEDLGPVSKCIGLNCLYLYDNKLTAVPDFGDLNQLSLLWLSNNRIASLQNIDKMSSLKELNISNNNIVNIDIIANRTTPLAVLNLSGNPLSNIKEIQQLSFFRKLHTLMMTDPLCRRSSVTLLDHFHSYVIFNLPNLKILDMIPITEALRRQINTFYVEKRRYYRLVMCNELAKSFSEEKIILGSMNDELGKIWTALHSYGLRENKITDKNSSNLLFWEAEADRWKEGIAFFLNYNKTFRECITHKFQLELELVGNLIFEQLNLVDNIIHEKFKDKIDSMICFHLKSKVIGVTLKHVWRIKGVFHTTVQQAQVSSSLDNVYVLCPVQDLGITPLQLLEQLIMGNRSNNQLKVTTCLVNADQLVSNISSLHRQLLLRSQQLLCSRMLILCAVANSIQITAVDDSARQCPYCWISQVQQSSLIPLYLVHFQYIFKDYFKPLKQSPPKPAKGLHPSFNQLFNQHGPIQNITKLVLSNTNIKQLYVPVMVHVTSVDLSYNEIEEISSFGSVFPKLTSLNLSFNKIKTLDNVLRLTNLTYLDLKWNFIANFLSSIQILQEMQYIKQLDLSWNPFQDVILNEQQVFFVTKYLKNIQTYNNQSLPQYPTVGEVMVTGQDQLPMIPCLHTSQELITLSWNTCLNSLEKGNHLCLASENIIGITLRKMNIKDFKVAFPIDKLTSLDISGNLVNDPLIITSMLKLRLVNMSYNTIESVSCFNETFKYLTHINLSYNLITSLSTFNSKVFPHLRVLDLSNNRIQSLEGISRIKTLLELYLAHNRLEDYQIMTHCRLWQELRVIDFSYNPLKNYFHVRQACVYYLHSIQFINGIKVHDDEVKSAFVYHGGLLNQDFLCRLYKRSALIKLSHLSHSNCSIKQVLIPTGILINLTSVTLEHNKITSLSWVQALPKLTRLNLSHNRVCCYSSDPSTVLTAQSSTSLHSLLLNHNCICNMASLCLELFPNLKLLVLSDNKISVISGLKNHLHLERLVLDRNTLSSVSKEQTENLGNLTALHLEQNSLSNLDFLLPLKKLENLFLASNKLISETALAPLAQLPDLRELTVHGNPLFRGTKSYLDHLPDIPSLQLLEGNQLPEYTPSS